MKYHDADLSGFSFAADNKNDSTGAALWRPGLLSARILIIDDDEQIRSILAQVFRENSYSADVASDGCEGLKKIILNNYDVILSDIDMPAMSGIEMYRLMKTHSGSGETRIIFMSGSPVHAGFIRDNNLDFIEKPFSIRDLLHKVECRCAY